MRVLGTILFASLRLNTVIFSSHNSHQRLQQSFCRAETVICCVSRQWAPHFCPHTGEAAAPVIKELFHVK